MIRTMSTPDSGSDTISSEACGPRAASCPATSTARFRSMVSIVSWTAERSISHAPPAAKARTSMTIAAAITVVAMRIGQRRGVVRMSRLEGTVPLCGPDPNENTC